MIVGSLVESVSQRSRVWTMAFTVTLLVIIHLIYSLPTDAVDLTVQGLVPAAYTPFHDDGKLNLDVISQYAEYLEQNHIDGVLLAGTSSEGPALSLDERKALLDSWLRAGKPRGLKIMVMVGGQAMPQVLEMAKYSEAAGADALLTLPELYYKPKTESAVVQYMKKISEAAPTLPILYYHHPSISGVNINVAEFFKKATSSIPNFKGMKCDFLCGLEVSASGELRKDQRLFMTSHLTMAPNLMMGLNSTCSAVVSIFPKMFLAIESAVNEGDILEARRLQQDLNRLMAVITSQGDYVPFSKAAMELVTGIKVGNTRDPLTRVTDEQKRVLAKSLHDINVL